MKDLIISQEVIFSISGIFIAIRLACGSFENFLAFLMFIMTSGTMYILLK